MSSDGRMNPCIDKAQHIHILEKQVDTNVNSEASLETRIETYMNREDAQTQVEVQMDIETAQVEMETHIDIENAQGVQVEIDEARVTTLANNLRNITIFFDANNCV